MKLPRSLATAGILLWATFSANGATPLINLANDNAALVIAIHDAPSLISQWQQSPWAKTWNDEQVKRYLAPLRAKWKVEDWSTTTREKTGFTLDELLALATGDAVLIVPDFEFVKEASGKVPPLLIGVDIGDNGSKIEALMAKTAKGDNDREETSEFSGVTIHTRHPAPKEGKENEPVVWALVEGKWLLSPSKDTIQSAIDAVKSGGVRNPLSQSDRYVKLLQRTTDAHVRAVLNLEAIYPAIKQAVEERAKSAAGQKEAAGGVDYTALLTAMGLDTLRDLYGSVRLSDTSTEIKGGVTFSENRGIVKLLAYHDGPPQTPQFVAANWISVGSSKFSFKEAYAALEEILENFNPAISGLVQGQIRTMNKQLGIDLKRDLIGSVGDTVVVGHTVSPNALPDKPVAATDFEQIFVFSLDNQDVFTNAIEAVKRSLGPQSDSLFTVRDYLGQKIYSFNNPGMPQAKGVSYSIAKGYFFLSIGSSSPIENALQGLSGNQPTLWDKPEVKASFAELPSNAGTFQYEDIRVIVGTIMDAIGKAGAMMNRPGPRPVPDAEGQPDAAPTPATPADSSLLVDTSAQPDAATIAKYWSHSWGYTVRETNGLHGVSHIAYPK